MRVIIYPDLNEEWWFWKLMDDGEEMICRSRKHFTRGGAVNEAKFLFGQNPAIRIGD